MNIAIVTDTFSGITKHDITGTNIFILQIPILADGKPIENRDMLSLSKLEYSIENSDVAFSTGIPSVSAIKEIWNYLLKTMKYDNIIHISSSSNLSKTYEYVTALATHYNNHVFVYDCKNISVIQKALVFKAKKMVSQGKTVEEIFDALDELSESASMYIMLPDPYYFKHNCTLDVDIDEINISYNLKPVYTIEDGELVLYSKNLSYASAKKSMLKAIDNDLNKKFKSELRSGDIELLIAYAGDIEESINLKEYFAEEYPDLPVTYVDEISIGLCTHFGTEVLLCGFIKK